jgi:long-chain acyl-CoA synthetase
MDVQRALRDLELECTRLRAQTSDDLLHAALVDAGMRAARARGFRDTYTMTKALAEGLIGAESDYRRLAIVRPSIIESAWSEPAPGWIDGVRMADPILLSYGRGQLKDFPGEGATVVDIVPVDLVAAAVLAVSAEVLSGGARDSSAAVPIFQVGSSASKPLLLRDLVGYAQTAFNSGALRDVAEPVTQLPPLRLVKSNEFREKLGRRRRLARLLLKVLPSKSSWARPLGEVDRVLDQLDYLARIYAPYLEAGAIYEDERTRALWSRVSEPERQSFAFDVHALDWRQYFVARHLPGLRRFVLGDRPRSEQLSLVATAAPGPLRADIVSAFQDAVKAYPTAAALQICRNGKWLRYDYRQAMNAVTIIATRLARRHGIQRGMRVLLWAESGPEFTLTSLAILKLGGVVVPLDPQWSVEEVASAQAMLDARLLCVAPRLHALLAERAPELSAVRLDSTFIPDPAAPEAPALEDTARAPSDTAAIFFTSGTTVQPKAVPLTHANFMSNAQGVLDVLKVRRPRVLAVLPAHHVVEFLGSLTLPLAIGGSVTFIDRIDGGEILRALQASQSTVMTVVPRLLDLFLKSIEAQIAAKGPVARWIFERLLTLGQLTGGRSSRVLLGSIHAKFGGHLRSLISVAAPLSRQTQRRLRQLGFGVVQAYGMTETSPVISMDESTSCRQGSVGRPISGVRVRIDAPPGEREGEIFVQGPNVMSGYLTRPGAENDEQPFADGWLRTGDLGFLDAQGYLTLTGRRKELILGASGKNVHPAEVEFRYRGVAGVRELCVLGIASPGSGYDTIHAVVVPETNQGTDLSAIQREIEPQLQAISKTIPSHQRVQEWHFRSQEIPKTSTLKFKRGDLREELRTSRPAQRSATTAPVTASALPTLGPSETWIAQEIATMAGIAPQRLRPEQRLLVDLGIDSLGRMQLIGRIERKFGVHVADDVIASIDEVADLLSLTASHGDAAHKSGVEA